MPCAGCELLPELPEVPGTLLIAPPLDHTRNKVAALITGQGLAMHQPYPGVIAAELAAGALATLLEQLADALSEPELAGSRTAFARRGSALDLGLLAAASTLSCLVGVARGQWLAEMIRHERLLSHFQPIVCAQSPTQVYAYECLLRGQDPAGHLVTPDRLFGAARAGQMLFHLDRAARITAIRHAAAQQLDTPIFINFMPTAIYDPRFCLRTTVETARATGWDPQRFVFEVVETEEVSDVNHLVAILKLYRDAGFRIALDDLGAGYGSLSLLQELRPDIVKLDRELISGVDQNPAKQTITSGLLRMARELGIASVAEGVETPSEWRWLRDQGADFMQGFLFAKPGVPAPRPVDPSALPEATG